MRMRNVLTTSEARALVNRLLPPRHGVRRYNAKHWPIQPVRVGGRLLFPENAISAWLAGRPIPDTDFEPSHTTVPEAAAILGVTRQRIHQLLRAGALQAERAGRMILIPCAEIAEHQRYRETLPAYHHHRKRQQKLLSRVKR